MRDDDVKTQPEPELELETLTQVMASMQRFSYDRHGPGMFVNHCGGWVKHGHAVDAVRAAYELGRRDRSAS